MGELIIYQWEGELLLFNQFSPISRFISCIFLNAVSVVVALKDSNVAIFCKEKKPRRNTTWLTGRQFEDPKSVEV